MNIEKMREEFEVWAVKRANASQYIHMDHLLDRSDERYSTTWVDCAWLGWKASRESLVIELPAENPLGSGPGDHGDGRPSFEQHCAAECNFILRDCRDAIHAAGVKTK